MPDAFQEELIQVMRAEIEDLPKSAIQIAGALVVAHPNLPNLLSGWIIYEMSKRVDMNTVSPVTEAAIHIAVLSQKFDRSVAVMASKSHYALIEAMQMEKDLDIAMAYVQKVINRLIVPATYRTFTNDAKL